MKKVDFCFYIENCPPKVSDSLDLTCTYNGLEVNCADPAINGTTLEPKCKDAYGLRNGQIEVPVKLVCHENGEWSNENLLYECVPSNFILFFKFIDVG